MIPKNLEETVIELDKKFPEKEINYIKSNNIKCMSAYHRGAGRWIRNNWGFWSDSELKQWFKEKGIDHADDMSSIVFKHYWCAKNDKNFDMDAQVAYYKKYWEAMRNKDYNTVNEYVSQEL